MAKDQYIATACVFAGLGFEPGVWTFSLLQNGARTGKLMLTDGAAVNLALNILALANAQRRLDVRERTALTAALLQRRED